MTIIVIEKITENVFCAVWLATLIMTYKERILKDTEKVYFEQTDILKLAQKICTKTVQPARVSQWCNADHPNNSYNYLRANGTKRRLTQIGEFNNRKEYPDRLTVLKLKYLKYKITRRELDMENCLNGILRVTQEWLI